jgi:hypothetical protein
LEGADGGLAAVVDGEGYAAAAVRGEGLLVMGSFLIPAPCPLVFLPLVGLV